MHEAETGADVWPAAAVKDSIRPRLRRAGPTWLLRVAAYALASLDFRAPVCTPLALSGVEACFAAREQVRRSGILASTVSRGLLLAPRPAGMPLGRHFPKMFFARPGFRQGLGISGLPVVPPAGAVLPTELGCLLPHDLASAPCGRV